MLQFISFSFNNTDISISLCYQSSNSPSASQIFSSSFSKYLLLSRISVLPPTNGHYLFTTIEMEQAADCLITVSSSWCHPESQQIQQNKQTKLKTVMNANNVTLRFKINNFVFIDYFCIDFVVVF